jgi:hypothetical protein
MGRIARGGGSHLMMLVERGNSLPTVALVQSLLNQQAAQVAGMKVDVTGYFDEATETMTRWFQRKMSLEVDGVVGPVTWRRLSMGRRLQVIDHVDAADDYHDSPQQEGYEFDLNRVGAMPIVSYTQSGGLMVAADRILRASRGHRVVLLRFHGHGGPGGMGVTVGRGDADWGGSRFALNMTDWREVADHFQALRNMFHPMGSVELHGCNIAGDRYVHGRRLQMSNGAGIGVYLLQRLAQLWGVPVTASPNPQYSHGRQILRFEGRTVTVCPDGIADIETWAQGRRA